jgi:TRAP-type mannitol/chloroaromatic compound transport system permease small subunit
MGLLLSASRFVDEVNGRVGRLIYWLILIVVLVSSTNAVIRKVFDMSSNAWLELQWYLFSAVFMGCAGYVLLANEHIRIDIVNSHLDRLTRNWIDVVGHVLFLIPLCLIMLYESWPYFLDAFVSGEMSGNAGGLIRWPVKLMMVVGFVLLLAQALSELIKRVAVMRGLIPDPHAEKSGPH